MKEELPTGWSKALLSEIALWGSGGTPSRKNSFYFQGTIPWIKTGELGPQYIFQTEEKITQEALTKSSAKLFPKGAIGIAMYGATIGKLSIFGIDACTNQACAVAVPIPGLICKEFLYYFLLSERRQLIEAGKGGAQPNISQEILKNWQIYLPPFAEQKRIVAKIEELFSEVDKGIENVLKAQELLKAYRQSMLKNAFEGKLTTKWREENKDLFESTDQFLIRIKQEREISLDVDRLRNKSNKHQKMEYPPSLSLKELEALPPLPSKWQWVKLDSIGNLLCGQSPSVSQVNFEGRGMLYVTGPEQWNGKEIEKTKWTEHPTRITPYDSIFITVKGAGVGKLFPGTHCVIGRDVYAFCPHRCMNRQFVIYALQHSIDLVVTKAQGDIPGLSKNHILEHIIGLPSPEEQDAIVKILDSHFSIIEKIHKDLEKQTLQTKKLRQIILKKAFSGELVSQDTNDEPVSTFLARIKAEKKTLKPQKKKSKQLQKVAV